MFSSEIAGVAGCTSSDAAYYATGNRAVFDGGQFTPGLGLIFPPECANETLPTKTYASDIERQRPIYLSRNRYSVKATTGLILVALLYPQGSKQDVVDDCEERRIGADADTGQPGDWASPTPIADVLDGNLTG